MDRVMSRLMTATGLLCLVCALAMVGLGAPVFMGLFFILSAVVCFHGAGKRS